MLSQPFDIITTCQRSCGKVMFSVVSVILSAAEARPVQVKLAHYEARTAVKRVVGIRVKYLIVSVKGS